MGKKYSTDETILLALYSEWLSDHPNNKRVNDVNLQMEPDVYLWGLMKLQKTGKISGVNWKPEYAATPDQVSWLTKDYLSLTDKGVECAQELAEVGKRRTEEALKIIAGIFRDIGIAAFSGMIMQG